MIQTYQGDCLEILRTLRTESVDAVVTDPPYPEIDRAYGRIREDEWRYLMDHVVYECKRVLKPSGSALFILQPNSEKVGRIRTWLWHWMAKWGDEWNIVQDAYWWNYAACPTVHTRRENGLLRPSLKYCVWMGDPKCYRNQEAVLWEESQANAALRSSARCGRNNHPSGQSMNEVRIAGASVERGGVTPFNVIPIANTNSTSSGGAKGHGAATPLPLCSWWVRYLCPPGGVVLDPFMGSGTVGLAVREHGCDFIGVEKYPEYYAIAQERLGLQLGAA